MQKVHMEMNYCRRCGNELLRHNESYICKNNHKIFGNPSPTVGVFFINGDKTKVLFAIRGIEPRKGTLDTPGGFIEPNETIEEAAKREIKEELGLEPSNYSSLQYLTSSPGDYPYQDEVHDIVSVFFISELSPKAKVTPTDDVESVQWFNFDEIPVDKIGNSDVKTATAILKKELLDGASNGRMGL